MENHLTPKQFLELIAKAQTADEQGEEYNETDAATFADEWIISARQILKGITQ